MQSALLGKHTSFANTHIHTFSGGISSSSRHDVSLRPGMETIEKVPAVLLLEDGTAYHGFSAKIGTTTGEICFNTGMTGYQEILLTPAMQARSC